MNETWNKIADRAVSLAKDVLEENLWTIYLFIDLQLVFVFTHMYTSAINLISSTANTEATKDRQSGKLFTVTRMHPNVSVTEIDDAVLWNCREDSVTKNYYRLLYFMCILALGIGLLTLLIVKLTTFVKLGCEYDRYTATKLWHMAVVQHLKKAEIDASKQSSKSRERDTAKDSMYIELLKEDAPEEVQKQITSFDKFCKTFIPCLLTVSTVCIMLFSFLSYDLHPVACLAEPGIDTIEYVNADMRVAIRYTGSAIVFQRVSYGIVFFLIFMHFIFAGLFNYHATKIKNFMLKKCEHLIKKKEDAAAPQ